LFLDVTNCFVQVSASLLLGILSLYCKQSGVLEVPEYLNWKTISADLLLDELVHVDIIDVKLCVRDANRRERALVTKDSELFAVLVKSDVFYLTYLLACLELELTGHTDLLVSAARDVVHLDQGLGGDHCHDLVFGVYLDDVAFLLCHGKHLLHLASKAAHFDLTLTALDYGVWSQSADVGVGLEVADQLGSRAAFHVV